MPILSSIYTQDKIDRIADSVSDLIKEKLSGHFVYHNLWHTEEVVAALEKMIDFYGLSAREKFALLAAGWCHDIGYSIAVENHEENGCKIAKKLLLSIDTDLEDINLILNLIRCTAVGAPRSTQLEQIMCDADLHYLGTRSYFEKANLLRKEWELVSRIYLTDTEWYTKNVAFFVTQHFLTQYAQENFEHQKLKNLTELKNKLASLS